MNSDPSGDKQRFYREVFRTAEIFGVTWACQEAGIGRTTYYKMLRRYKDTGALKDQSRARKSPPQLAGNVLKAISRCKSAHPSWGAKRISSDLKRRQIAVSASAIERLWRRQRQEVEAADRAIASLVDELYAIKTA